MGLRVLAIERTRDEETTMTIRSTVLVAGLVLAVVVAFPPTGQADQSDIKLFAPAREARRAIQVARSAGAAELAPRDLRLAEEYYEEGAELLRPPDGPPDDSRAARRFRLAGGQARVAETRAIEVTREREAAGAGSQYLGAIEFDPQRILPPRPSMGQAAGEYRLRQKRAAEARAARRAAEETMERLRVEGG